MRCRMMVLAAVLVVTGALVGTQGDRRPASPAGSSATQVGGKYVPGNDGPVYVPAGTYTVFIDLKPNNWTLIVSTWEAQKDYDPNNTKQVYGGYGYTPEKDVVRAPMTLGTLPFSHDQLTWEFLDMTDAGGKLAIMWDKVVASVPFKVGT